MNGRNPRDRRITTDRWPPVDRWPPADAHLHADRWQHPEEGLAVRDWSVDDQWLPLDVILAALDDDDDSYGI